jgi:hypothetical protein
VRDTEISRNARVLSPLGTKGSFPDGPPATGAPSALYTWVPVQMLPINGKPLPDPFGGIFGNPGGENPGSGSLPGPLLTILGRFRGLLTGGWGGTLAATRKRTLCRVLV